ncbi:MAG TPA: amidohydrolase family protein, partial [Acetobacteraceae bacterium]|nr:amidohydrolase family protein [Acetobacteraceae bacterium]
MIISAPRLFRDGAITGPGAVVVGSGVIDAVLDFVPPAAEDHVALDHGMLTPGLIDTHNNGAFGVNCAAADTEGFTLLCSRLAEHGITAFLPTIITAPIENLIEAAGRVRAARDALSDLPICQIMGLHLEGPFLAPEKRGVHREGWLRQPDNDSLDKLLTGELLVVLRMVTLAPELPGAIMAIRRLAAMGVAVSIGHSKADAKTAQAAVDAGASLATHVFNAMRPFNHRDPGIIGVALSDRRLFACFIADGVHADPVALRAGFAAAGTRAVAV